jgi:hypothetical protein
MTKEEQKKEVEEIQKITKEFYIPKNTLFKTTLDKLFKLIVETFKKDNEKGYRLFKRLPSYTKEMFLVDYCTLEEVEIYFYILEKERIFNN